jgi:hypothetical protein
MPGRRHRRRRPTRQAPAVRGQVNDLAACNWSTSHPFVGSSQCLCWLMKVATAQASVIRTGRRHSIPASRMTYSNGSPFSCISSMKSKSTITWLTMTPIRLAIPGNAMNPKEIDDSEAYQRSGENLVVLLAPIKRSERPEELPGKKEPSCKMGPQALRLLNFIRAVSQVIIGSSDGFAARLFKKRLFAQATLLKMHYTPTRVYSEGEITQGKIGRNL